VGSRTAKARSRVVILTILAVAAAGTLIPVAGAEPADPADSIRAAVPKVSPCGKGDATDATDVGVTDDTITIATIQDVGGLRPGLFKANQKAMEAFVAWCNSVGGINGRKLDLVKYDSALLDAYPQYVRACDEAFAIVGEAVIFDDAGSQPTGECGIPSVVALATTAARQSGKLAIGRYRWLKQRYPGVVKRAAMLYPNTSTTKSSGEKTVAGAEQVGFDFVYQGVTEINVVNWGPFVDQIRQHDITYLAMVADFVNWAGLQREMVAQGVKAMVVDGISSLYTPEYLDQVGTAAEGTLIPLPTAMFEEANRIPELARYLKWMKKVGGTPSSISVQGWSAGLLFAAAAQSLGSNLTREGLVTALDGIHRWNGNGVHGTSDPGARIPSSCYLVLEVHGGEFTRLYPNKPATFACSKDDIVTVPSDL
jgi:ABC-type branched-subunit amino acid transport system substrate-binding protein